MLHDLFHVLPYMTLGKRCDVMNDMKVKFQNGDLNQDQKIVATGVITETQSLLGQKSFKVLGLQIGDMTSVQIFEVLKGWKEAGNMTDEQNTAMKDLAEDAAVRMIQGILGVFGYTPEVAAANYNVSEGEARLLLQRPTFGSQRDETSDIVISSTSTTTSTTTTTTTVAPVISSSSSPSNPEEGEGSDATPMKEITGKPLDKVDYHPGPFAAVNKAKPPVRYLPGFLRASTVAELWKPQPGASVGWGGDALGYGLGWAVRSKKKVAGFARDDFFYVTHTGGAIGASSVLLVAPKPVNCSF